MLFAGIFYALMNLGVKFLSDIPAVEIVFFRAIITLIISYVMIRGKKLSPWGNNKKILILRGVFGLLGLSMYFYSLQHLPFATAVTLMQLSPIFTAILGVFLLKEHIDIPQWLFFALAFIGVIIIKGFDPDMNAFDFWIAIGASVASALAYNMVRKLKNTDHPLVVVFYFPLIAMPITGVYSAMNWVMPQNMDWPILLGIGVSTQIAQVYMTKALQMEKLGTVSIVRYLGIVYALIFGAFLFGEHYTLYTLLGIFLVVVGVISNIIYSRRMKRRLKPIA